MISREAWGISVGVGIRSFVGKKKKKRGLIVRVMDGGDKCWLQRLLRRWWC